MEVLHHHKIFKILKSPVELDISANKSIVGFHVKDEESFEPLVVAKSSQQDNEDVALVIHQPRGIRKVRQIIKENLNGLNYLILLSSVPFGVKNVRKIIKE